MLLTEFRFEIYRRRKSMKSGQLTWSDVCSAFKSGAIYNKNSEHLRKCIQAIANESIANSHIRHRAIVMSNTLNFLLTKKLLDEQEKRNRITARWFMILAIGSLLMQTYAIFWHN